jgi:hypothetical protein
MDNIFDRLDEIDPEALRRAFEALLPAMQAQTRLRRANTDLHKAIIFAASVGREVRRPEVRAEFARLPPECFDIAHLDRLEQAADAAWYAYAQLQHAAALHTDARLPAPVVAEAVALKQRMLRVLAYNLDHLDDVPILLADIRPATGYLDLPHDLLRLAGLYQEHAATLAVDVRRYQAGDAATAGRLALEMSQVLGDGMPSDTRSWTEHLSRAWTLLLVTYGEVSATGRWLFRARNGKARFPSLYTIGRRPRRKRNPRSTRTAG